MEGFELKGESSKGKLKGESREVKSPIVCHCEEARRSNLITFSTIIMGLLLRFRRIAMTKTGHDASTNGLINQYKVWRD